MKHLKSNSNDMGWQGVVYKMKEAEEDGKRLSSVKERVNIILKEEKNHSFTPIKKAKKKP